MTQNHSSNKSTGDPQRFCEMGRLSWWERQGAVWYSSLPFSHGSLGKKQAELLSILAIVHRDQLDPIPIVEHLASEHRGAYRKILLQLAKRLQSDRLLVPALEQCPDALSENEVLALRCGSNLGMLSQTFDSLIDARNQAEESESLQSSNRVYYAVLALMIFLIMWFHSSMITPTFAVMHRDFGTKQPDSLRFIAGFFDAIQSFPLLCFLVVVLAGFVIQSSSVRQVVRRLFHRLGSWFPFSDKTAVVLRVLSVACASDRPVSAATSTLAKYHSDHSTRRQLLFARNEMEQGEDEWTSLMHAKLLSVQEIQALAASPNQQSLAWVLQNLANAKAKRFQCKREWIHSFVHPVVMILFGLFVLWVCLAFFSSLPLWLKSLAQ